MSTWKRKEGKIAVIGMGYVGMPLALAFAEHFSVLGFDINKEKINQYRNGIDPTDEVGNDVIANTTVEFIAEEERLKEAGVFIIAVPTPVNQDGRPNLRPVIHASEMIAKYMEKDCLVIYESTVYPGVTEDICIPRIEAVSGMVSGRDFKVGYSPERINPGDKEHRLQNICKIVSACDEEALEVVSEIYQKILDNSVYKASSIKVAEAAKLAENTQRDVNIAFMNELAMAFDCMGIDTMDVINAMNTKWNALKFYPGLVGGHCIGVDPYYFIYEAYKLGYNSQIVSNARKINDNVAEFIVDAAAKLLAKEGVCFPKAKVYVFGATFKEDCPDLRNSKVENIVEYLCDYGINPQLVEPVAEQSEVEAIYGRIPVELALVGDADCIIFAVPHKEFRTLTLEQLDEMYQKNTAQKKIFIDVKSIFNKKEMEKHGYCVWRL